MPFFEQAMVEGPFRLAVDAPLSATVRISYSCLGAAFPTARPGDAVQLLLRALLTASFHAPPAASEGVVVDPPDNALALTWSAQPPCPGEHRFVERLEKLVGGTIQRHPEALLGATVTLQPQSPPERGWHAALSLRRGTSTEHRHYSASSCAELVDAAVVTVAAHVLLHRESRATPPVPSPPEPPGVVVPESSSVVVPESPGVVPESPGVAVPEFPGVAVPESRGTITPISPGEPVDRRPESMRGGKDTSTLLLTEDPDPPPPPQRRRPSSAALEVLLAFQGGLVGGLGPRFGGLAEVGASLGYRFFRAELAAWHRFASDAEPSRGIIVRGSLSGGTLLGCGVPRVRNVLFPVCIGLSVAAAVARGRGNLEQPITTVRAWVGVPVRVGVVWYVSPRVGLRLTLLGSLGRRTGFFAESSEGEVTIFEYPRLGGGALAGLEFRWR